ncbi:lysoplasmalogenase [Shimia litoralis]|uniref:Lysoplasmalogenase n=1 Tax=Shimia litoralis TaxID=420403 RepID=A0A4U7N791_9RHOB|nr:lysoplasmalogenase [Shimia litoralis]TKZ21608.1 lysoplasmalogenase [Shimia litoralis]
MSILEEIALRQSFRLGFLLVGVSFALVYVVGFCYRGPSMVKTLVKAVPLLSFAAAVGVTFGHPLIILALVSSAIGDIALSRSSDKPFLVGLISFAIAHVFYIVHFWGLSGGLDGALALPVAAAALVIFALSTEVWLGPFTDEMRWPVRVYVVLITVMGLTALGLNGMPLAMFGAFAFLMSDTLLSIQLFRMSDHSVWQVPTSVVLWLLYAGGQFAILAGAGWSTPLFQIW